MNDNALFVDMLSIAVPMWIERLKRMSLRDVLDRSHELAHVVASTSDNVLFKSKRAGDTAAAFNALAEGIACLAFAPGGVKTFGMHFEATHPDVLRRKEESADG